ncbi:MAG: PadR family transcriptional regulator [Thaumarchaeota archaeon]|nr:PadR family transcriptional regulator [Nitrososphaerota archaeon]
MNEVDVEMCDMRGMLTFMILWLLAKRPMFGQEIAYEIKSRKGEKPNPGTLYPALKELSRKGLVTYRDEGRNRVYELTPRGVAVLRVALGFFRRAYGEMIGTQPRRRIRPAPVIPRRG